MGSGSAAAGAGGGVPRLGDIEQDQLFVVWDDSRADGSPSLLFHDPQDVVTCTDPSQILSAFERIETGVRAGLHVAGWFSYELGYHLEPRLAPLAPSDPGQPPLIMMGLFRERTEMTPPGCDAFWEEAPAAAAVAGVRPAMDRAAYVAAVEAVRELILDGATYQVNLTMKCRFTVDGSPTGLYSALRKRQRTRCSAFVGWDGGSVLSLSPEVFFTRSGSHIEVRPMKGTLPRTGEEQDVVRSSAWLRADPKSRAENIMIVDLLRNDLARISVPGTVRVPSLLDVERYETVLQMTSTIEAELAGDPSVRRLIEALFPCGSVTGAPKVSTMEIIRALEPEPRGVYTGAIGYVSGGEAAFNVAIRTLFLDDGGAGELGVGSGILVDSDAGAEYEECVLKGKFLTDLTN